MPQQLVVGRSWRTPAKHELLNKQVGRIAGAATTNRVGANRFVGYDLTAGDGIPADDTDFWQGTSPGILIRHAAATTRPPQSAKFHALKRAVVLLYEINANTFGRLINSLTTHLGPGETAPPTRTVPAARFDYIPPGSTEVAVTVLAFCDSGKNASLGCISQGDCVFVCNDPNSIHEWAMYPTMIRDILSKTWMCTTFSTLGCNACGIKMLPREAREMWYPHLQSIKNNLPRYTDLVLAAVERDAAQWAYAITVPTANERTHWRQDAEKDILAAFKRIGRNMRVVWWSNEPVGFRSLEDELFLTKAERLTNAGGMT